MKSSYMVRDYSNKENERPLSSFINQNHSPSHRPASGVPSNVQAKKTQAADARYSAISSSSSMNSSGINKLSGSNHYQPTGNHHTYNINNYLKQSNVMNRSKSPPQSRGNSPTLYTNSEKANKTTKKKKTCPIILSSLSELDKAMAKTSRIFRKNKII